MDDIDNFVSVILQAIELSIMWAYYSYEINPAYSGE